MGRWITALEGLVSMFWKGRKVFVTGHTGFKGSWLTLWLEQLGADVMGYALAPDKQPNLFEAVHAGSAIKSILGNVCDQPALHKAITGHDPEIVIHMAAQPLVRLSYEDPLTTYATNVLGTANLLEAVRSCKSVRAVVVITTDKVYENKEWIWAYRENDSLGGFDPYSSSKACAELVVSSFRDSFFPISKYQDHRVAIATPRAGNVIGGGDWSKDRLLPDIARAFASGEVLKIRNPKATRPWQHVLEPLRGYLLLAQKLYEHGTKFSGGWNLGPEYADAKPVEWIVEYAANEWGPSAKWEIDRSQNFHEAQMLMLDWTKAWLELGWRPRLQLKDALDLTVGWYRDVLAGKKARAKCVEQIERYQESPTVP
jgi:CDP-glucose 4,6-dehydratase